MPTKKGAGGRQQNYDPRTGRFAKTDIVIFPIGFRPPWKNHRSKHDML